MRFFLLIKQVLIKPMSCLLALALLALPSLAFEQATYQSHQLKNKTLTVTTNQGQVSLSAYSDSAIAVHYLFTNSSNKADQLPSYAIKENAIKQEFDVSDNKSQLTISLGKISAVISKSPFNISFYQDEKLLLAEEAVSYTHLTLPTTPYV